MNWNALGAVAELLGAVGVISSLFYVASQIRRNSTALAAATNQAVADATQQRLLAPAQSPELAAALAKALGGLADLSPAERIQITFFRRSTFRGIQNAFFQHRAGLISPASWRDYEEVLRNHAQIADVKDWWQADRHTFDEAFATHYEAIMSEAPAAQQVVAADQP